MKNTLAILSLAALLAAPNMNAIPYDKVSPCCNCTSYVIENHNKEFKTLRDQYRKEEKRFVDKQKKRNIPDWNQLFESKFASGLTEKELNSVMHDHLQMLQENAEFQKKLALKYGPQLTALREQDANKDKDFWCKGLKYYPAPPKWKRNTIELANALNSCWNGKECDKTEEDFDNLIHEYIQEQREKTELEKELLLACDKLKQHINISDENISLEVLIEKEKGKINKLLEELTQQNIMDD